MSNIVQSVGGFTNSGTTLVLTLPQPTTPGNLLILASGYFSTGGFTSAVLGHDTLVHLGQNANGSVKVEGQAKTGITGGDTSCTLTFAAGIGVSSGTLVEVAAVSGADAGAENDVFFTTIPITNTTVVAAAPCFLLGAACWQAAATAPTGQSAGWAALPDVVTNSGTNDIRLVTSYLYALVTGSQGNTWTATTTSGAGFIAPYDLSSLIPDPAYHPWSSIQRLRNPNNIH